MSTILIILIAIAALAAVVALVRGLVIFLKTTEADLKAGPDGGPSLSAQRSNKMMMARVGFQAAAVLLVALLILLQR